MSRLSISVKTTIAFLVGWLEANQEFIFVSYEQIGIKYLIPFKSHRDIHRKPGHGTDLSLLQTADEWMERGERKRRKDGILLLKSESVA